MDSTAPAAEQAENSVKTNYFGTKNVCKELFPLLRPHARVVNLSSAGGRLSTMPKTPHSRKNFELLFNRR
ncbi:Uncharacterised protein r2_g424 [Pycnogonum litorale]